MNLSSRRVGEVRMRLARARASAAATKMALQRSSLRRAEPSGWGAAKAALRPDVTEWALTEAQRIAGALRGAPLRAAGDGRADLGWS